MREYIIADNQDITKAGMMFLLSKQKEVSLLLEADNKMELVQLLRIHPQAVVILDYTLFDFSGADELIILQERFKESDWLLFSDELSLSLIHISEPTRPRLISYAVFCLKKFFFNDTATTEIYTV